MLEIEEYLAGLAPLDAEIIGNAYATARTFLPEVEQGLSYGMPALMFSSLPLLSVMRAKQHFGVYPYSGGVVSQVLETLNPPEVISSSKGTLRLPLGAPIPEILITELVRLRREEIIAKNASMPKRRSLAKKNDDKPSGNTA